MKNIVLSLALLVAGSVLGASPKPNVLFIAVDDLRAEVDLPLKNKLTRISQVNRDKETEF